MEVRRLALGRVEQHLKTPGKLRLKPPEPICVDEAHIDEVSQIRSVFVAERSELDAHQRLDREYRKLPGVHALTHVRVSCRLMWAHALVGEREMNGVARTACRLVEEDIKAADMPLHESGGLHRDGRALQVCPAHQ